MKSRKAKPQENPIFCMVLQCIVPGKGMGIWANTVQIEDEIQATSWFLGFIAGAKIPFIPERDTLDIFRYEGTGGMNEAQAALEKYVKDSADMQGAPLHAIDDFPGEIRQAIEEILRDEFEGKGEGQEHSFEGDEWDLPETVEPPSNDVLDRFFEELGRINRMGLTQETDSADDTAWWQGGECSMCGKPAPSQDENGMCPSCRQVWNS